MQLTESDFYNTKCVECKMEKATNLLRLGERKDGYYICNCCKVKLARFLDKCIASN